VLYVPLDVVVAIPLYWRLLEESVTSVLTKTPAAGAPLCVTVPLIVTNEPCT